MWGSIIAAGIVACLAFGHSLGVDARLYDTMLRSRLMPPPPPDSNIEQLGWCDHKHYENLLTNNETSDDRS